MKQSELIKKMLDSDGFQIVIANALKKVAEKEGTTNPYKDIMRQVDSWSKENNPNARGLVDFTKDKTDVYGIDMQECGFRAGIDFAMILLGQTPVYGVLPDDMLEYDL